MLKDCQFFWRRAYFQSSKSGDSFLLGCVREVLVDFGFGKLLEYVERQFGKLTLNVLLALILGAIGTVTLNIIIKQAILPLYGLFHALDPSAHSRVFSIILGVTLGVLGFWAFTHILFKWVIDPRIKKLSKSAEERISHIKEQQAKVQKMIDQVSDELQMLEDLNKKINTASDVVIQKGDRLLD